VISYAQNAEDVVLARALRGTTGFYVDVGAGDPEIASVTKHFYDLGWRGINIEPRSDAISLLDEQRPRDTNLRLAAGATAGETKLFLVEADLDMSTTDEVDLELLRDRGYEVHVETVPVQTLDRILEEHGVSGIDFLKIDVEGSEADVLAGVDLIRWHPSVVVVESIKPWSHERTDASWRSVLESQGYREALFDGVNLFFARKDDRETIAALVPASVLDEYEPAAMAAMRAGIEQLREYVAKLEGELQQHRDLEKKLSDYVSTLESELQVPTDVASIIDLTSPHGDDGAPRVARPLAPARVAIVGTPRTGDSWIGRVLADALGARELSTAHPGDLDWDGLPDRLVLQLHWPRSRYLEHALRAQGFGVISPARHPLDVLLSILASSQGQVGGDVRSGGQFGVVPDLEGYGPHDSEFLDWALSAPARWLLSLTPDWWSTPTTHRVRYEELVEDAHTGFASLLEQCELEVLNDLNLVVARNTLTNVTAGERVEPGAYAWRDTFDGDSVGALMSAYGDVVAALGYDLADRTLS
jgi:FkbM family methyltransferase